MAKPQSEDQHSEVETVRRREAAIKKMQATPPKPHKDITGKKGKSPEQKAR